MKQKTEKNSDLIPVGALWTNISRNGNKYWSGKLELAELVMSSLNQKGIENDVILNIVDVLQDQGLDIVDLIMFSNPNRRDGKQEPTLNLFSRLTQVPSASFDEAQDNNVITDKP